MTGGEIETVVVWQVTMMKLTSMVLAVLPVARQPNARPSNMPASGGVPVLAVIVESNVPVPSVPVKSWLGQFAPTDRINPQ